MMKAIYIKILFFACIFLFGMICVANEEPIKPIKPKRVTIMTVRWSPTNALATLELEAGILGVTNLSTECDFDNDKKRIVPAMTKNSTNLTNSSNSTNASTSPASP